MIKTIFFDADETLYPEKHLKVRAELETAEFIADHLKLPLNSVWDVFYKEKWDTLTSGDKTPYSNSRENWYKKTLASLNGHSLTSFELADYYWDIINKHIEPYYDVILALPKLAEKYDLYIVTDEYIEIIKRKIKSLGFEKYFKDVISGEHVNLQKPDKALFELALKTTQADIETTLMIGDYPAKDIKGAKGTGLKTALLKRGHYYKPILEEEIPDIYISNFINLERDIEELL